MSTKGEVFCSCNMTMCSSYWTDDDEQHGQCTAGEGARARVANRTKLRGGPGGEDARDRGSGPSRGAETWAEQRSSMAELRRIRRETRTAMRRAPCRQTRESRRNNGAGNLLAGGRRLMGTPRTILSPGVHQSRRLVRNLLLHFRALLVAVAVSRTGGGPKRR
jgi:hypothetical protein